MAQTGQLNGTQRFRMWHCAIIQEKWNEISVDVAVGFPRIAF